MTGWNWQNASNGDMDLEKENENKLDRQENRLAKFSTDKWKEDSNKEHNKKVG